MSGPALQSVTWGWGGGGGGGGSLGGVSGRPLRNVNFKFYLSCFQLSIERFVQLRRVPITRYE